MQVDVAGTRLEVHQLLCGRDIAKDIRGNLIHQYAYQMANYVYLVVDPDSKDAFVVDPAWDVDGIFEYCADEGVKCTKAFFTHRHFDHTGGYVPKEMVHSSDPIVLPGLLDFRKHQVPVYVGARDVSAVAHQCRIDVSEINALENGESFKIGPTEKLIVLNTPGHTPGSVCFALAAGDTTQSCTLLFSSCGRCDLPESNVKDMMESLEKVSKLPDHIIVLPGHNYSMPAHSTVGQEKETNSMMMQAMARGLTPQSTCATIPLPDYLGVCRKIFDIYSDPNKILKCNAAAFESHF